MLCTARRLWRYSLVQCLTKRDLGEIASSEGFEDVEEFRTVVQDFAREHIAPYAARVDQENTFPSDVNLWKSMANFGLHGTLCSSLNRSRYKSILRHYSFPILWGPRIELLAPLHRYGRAQSRFRLHRLGVWCP